MYSWAETSQLAGKCDGCVFNVDCLSESGRLRRLELLGIEPSVSATLRADGVETIDDLATLDLGGPAARALRQRPGFTESLQRLRARAQARRSTLPRGGEDPDNYQVRDLPRASQSQLPDRPLPELRVVRLRPVHKDGDILRVIAPATQGRDHGAFAETVRVNADHARAEGWLPSFLG